MFIVSRAFCENSININLVEHAENLLGSYNFVKLCQKQPNSSFVFKMSVNFFHEKVLSKKYKKALHVLISTMDISLSQEEIEEKVEEIIDIFSKISPILLDNMNVNGMIASSMNFFINSNLERLLLHFSQEKNKDWNSQVLQCAIIRLLFHESTHLVIRYLQSKKKKLDFLKGTPDRNKDSKMANENLYKYEGGNRMEEILIGSCSKIFYNDQNLIEKFLDDETWDNDSLPIFEAEELDKMEKISKNFFFSGIDNDILTNFE